MNELKNVSDFNSLDSNPHFQVFKREMKRCYGLSNKEAIWRAMEANNEKLNAKIYVMLERLKSVPIDAIPEVFRHVIKTKEIPSVTDLWRAWKEIEGFYNRSKQSYEMPQLKPRGFEPEGHAECMEELKKMRLLK